MSKRTNNQRRRALARQTARRGAQGNPGGDSNYARKKIWLHKNAMWGFDVPEPKPWKRAAQ